jgi:hypothetical protein
MKVKYKEDSRAWRKNTLLSVLALLVLSSVLCWRRVLPVELWRAVMALLIVVGITAWCRPGWFRGYYRFSTWAGFWSSQAVARLALALLFVLVMAPAGIILRLLGKDPLSLKRSPGATSYWRPARQEGPLDRLF